MLFRVLISEVKVRWAVLAHRQSSHRVYWSYPALIPSSRLLFFHFGVYVREDAAFEEGPLSIPLRPAADQRQAETRRGHGPSIQHKVGVV